MKGVTNWEDQKKLPVADAVLLLKKAKQFAILFAREVSNDIIEQAAEEMRDNYQFEKADTVREAQDILFLEQDGVGVLFENLATQFIAKNENENWKIIKQVGKETMLGDFRDFINTLIAKHGSSAKFYIDSDHGDEYFVLTLKAKK